MKCPECKGSGLPTRKHSDLADKCEDCNGRGITEPKFFWYENPDTRNLRKIWFDDIEDIAFEHGDDRKVEDMSDDDFYKYVDEFLGD